MNQLNKLKKRKARETTPPDDPVRGAPTSSATSGAVNDKLTTIDVLQNTSTFLEILRNVGDATQVLGPLKAICGVLKIATDTAVLLVNNGEDLQELVDLLQPQQTFLESEIAKLSNSEYSNSENVQDLVEPLKTYILDLKSLHDKLDTIKARYNDKSKRKRVKKVLMAQTDRDQILGFTKKLENSFRHFMHSVTTFIARQTLLMRNEMASMQVNMASMQENVASMRENMSRMKKDLEEKDAMDLLNKLTYAKAQGHQHELCAEGTRIEILDQIKHWAGDTTAKPIFTIMDRAGTGKSTIAATMAQEWENEGSLLARFFFSKPSVVTAKDVPNTLAKDIVKNASSLRPHVIEALKKHEDYANFPIREQLGWLVFNPLRSLDVSRIIVVDALDECSKEDRGHLLKSLLNFFTSISEDPCSLKVLITSRPEEDMVSLIREPRYAISIHRCTTSLYSDQNQSNEADIRLYATRLLANYLTSEQLERFIKRADGLFIWAATVQRFITEALDPSSRFEELMSSGSIHSPLSALYDEILDASLNRVGQDGEGILRMVVGVISVAREPLLVEVIDEILGLRSGIASRVVMILQSVLAGGSGGEPVQIMHPTFLEHIQESQSCRLVVTAEKGETVIAKGCLSILLSRLKYDNCDTFQLTKSFSPYGHLKDFWRADKLNDLEHRVRENTTPGLRYAAVYGISHVTYSLHNQDVVEQLRTFFKTKLLNWIELMSLLDKIILLMQAVHYLKERIDETINAGQGELISDDVGWCEDILTMIRPLQSSIEQSASQIYFSALPFISVTSRMACYFGQFIDKIPRVVRGRETERRQAVVLSGHTEGVFWVLYSPDCRYLVSSSHTVRIWDAITGAAIHTLNDCHYDILDFSMSPDGRHIAFALYDWTIQIWETATGVLLHTLSEHTDQVLCLSFSPCGRYIASGSYDSTVRIWDSTTGSIVHVLTSHTEEVICASFSPDGSHLASGSEDTNMVIYDVVTGATMRTLGHDGSVRDIIFSPDGRYLVSLSAAIQLSTKIRIWDGLDGILICTLDSQINWPCFFLISSDGKYFVSTSTDNTIQMWETATGSPTHTFTGHTERIRCITFSPDGRYLASGSEDRTVRIWDSITRALLHIFTEYTNPVGCLAFSPDGRHLASGSDRILYIWDLSAPGTHAGYTEGTSNPLPSLDERRLALGSVDKMDDMTSDGVTHKNVGHNEEVRAMKFSPDGWYLVSGSFDGEIRIWDVATGESLHILTGHTRTIVCLAFSSDSQYLASGSADNTVRIWDVATSGNIHALTGHTSSIKCLAFSPNDQYLASGSEDKTVRIWDVVSGTSIGEPLRHPNTVRSVSFHSQQETLMLTVAHSLYYYSPIPTMAWNLSTSSPSLHPIQDLPMASTPTESIPVEFGNPWTYIPNTSILFSLPSYFICTRFCSHEGRLGYGGQNGSVIIVDCSHLL